MNKAKRSNQMKHFKKLRHTYQCLMRIHFGKGSSTNDKSRRTIHENSCNQTNDKHIINVHTHETINTIKSQPSRSIDCCQGDKEEFELKTSLDEKENDTNDGWNGATLSV